MLTAAKAGAVIDLGNRAVGFVRTPAADVTIRGGRFHGVVLQDWKNVTFEGSTFEIADNKGTLDYLVLAYNPQGITFRNCTFRGTDFNGVLQVAGFSVRGGQGFAVEKSTLHQVSTSASFVRTADVRFVENDLSLIREGVQLAGVKGALIARNKIGPFRPATGDHADGVQMFTAGLTQPDDTGSRDVQIRDNLILSSPEGRAQGVFIRDEAGLYKLGRGYANVTIAGNVLIGTGWHGIAADPVDGLVIDANTLLRVDGADSVKNNWIKASGGRVTNNRAGGYILDPAVEVSANVTTGDAAAADQEAAQATWMAAEETPAEAHPAARSATTPQASEALEHARSPGRR